VVIVASLSLFKFKNDAIMLLQAFNNMSPMEAKSITLTAQGSLHPACTHLTGIEEIVGCILQFR
jgi:hypothetical protein